MEKLMEKLTSRKFLISVAAFLASIGAGVTGIATQNEILAAIGAACTILSAAIYAATEAYVDAASLKANTTATNISATTNDTQIVEKMTGAVQPIDLKVGGSE